MAEWVDVQSATRREPSVTFVGGHARINASAWRALGAPGFVKIMVDRTSPETVRIIPALRSTPNAVTVSSNQCIGRTLLRYITDRGYVVGTYPATVDGDALVIRLETAA